MGSSQSAEEKRKEQERVAAEKREEEEKELRKGELALKMKKAEYDHLLELEKQKTIQKSSEMESEITKIKENNDLLRKMGLVKIIDKTFEKVQDVDIAGAACATHFINAHEIGCPIDKEVLKAIRPTAPGATNLVETCEEDEMHQTAQVAIR